MPKPVALPIAPAAADPAQEVITLLRQIAADLHTLATPDRRESPRMTPRSAACYGRSTPRSAIVFSLPPTC